MSPVSRPNNAPQSLELFADEFAEILELKLLGADTIEGEPWGEYASKVLSDYHDCLATKLFNQKPLWRELHEISSQLDPTSSPHLRYSHFLVAIADRLQVEFMDTPGLDFLRIEAKRALNCE